MNCDVVRDLSGAYALGSVTPEEKRQIEEHLAGCDLHDEIVGLRATGFGLADAAPEMVPSSGLGDRISAAVRAESAAVAPSGKSRFGVFKLRRAASWPIAAVLVLAVGALVAWNLVLQLDDPAENLVNFVKEPGGEWVRVEAPLGEPGTTFSLGGLDPLPSGRDYQLWAVRDEEAHSLGVFDTDDDGKWSGDMDFPLRRGDQIAITEETEGGASAPTTEPLISTRL